MDMTLCAFYRMTETPQTLYHTLVLITYVFVCRVPSFTPLNSGGWYVISLFLTITQNNPYTSMCYLSFIYIWI
jgi:hypothetical protein